MEKINEIFNLNQDINISNIEFSEIDYDLVDFENCFTVRKEVCKVLHCEPIKKSKMLKMLIQTKYDLRVCLTNVGNVYESEYFIGKNFVFTLNLKPATIKGIESNAMISAFETDNKEVIIYPIDLEIGTKFI